jgi:hypothetical protein
MCSTCSFRYWSYEEEDTSASYEEEDTSASYEEEDTSASYEEEDTSASRDTGACAVPAHSSASTVSKVLSVLRISYLQYI